VVARNLRDDTVSGCGRDPEPVARPLHDERRHHHGVQLGQPAGGWVTARTPRRLERECQAQDADGAGLPDGPAGHASAQRPSADDEREPAQLTRAQVLDHRRPGGVELASRGRRTAAGDPVGLLHERDVDPLRERRLGRGDEIGSRNPTAGAVTEDERACRRVGAM